jgi:hypothetical protein
MLQVSFVLLRREIWPTMSGTAVIVKRLSSCPFRLSTCSFASHQLHVSRIHCVAVNELTRALSPA